MLVIQLKVCKLFLLRFSDSFTGGVAPERINLLTRTEDSFQKLSFLGNG